MKIAVTYENGQVFQHFGHTAQFKLYDVENGTVASSQVVDTNGSGHGALAGFLKDRQVDALICGGIGGGAQMALAEAGIRLYAGCQGDADTRVAELLAGTLVSADAATITTVRSTPAATTAAATTRAAIPAATAETGPGGRNALPVFVQHLLEIWDSLSA